MGRIFGHPFPSAGQARIPAFPGFALTRDQAVGGGAEHFLVAQALDRLDAITGRGEDPSNTTMVADPTIAWPARMAIATDGQEQSLEHVREIMGTSMESLIHHFKLVTQGFRVPAGQVYTTVEHAKGVMGVHAVSDGGTRPYRVHFRDPSFSNLQSLAMMGEGGMIADLVPSLASIDPVLGGVDR